MFEIDGLVQELANFFPKEPYSKYFWLYILYNTYHHSLTLFS